MKNFNEEHFIDTLMNAPWDTCFVFDDIDDVLASWESIYNDALDLCCPWQEKKVRRKYQSPWITR